MLFLYALILLPYYSLIYRKTLYVYTTICISIDIYTKLISKHNNLYKHWYIDKSYIYSTHIYTYTHIRTWYIIYTYTCVHVRTHVYIYT